MRDDFIIYNDDNHNDIKIGMSFVILLNRFTNSSKFANFSFITLQDNLKIERTL